MQNAQHNKTSNMDPTKIHGTALDHNLAMKVILVCFLFYHSRCYHKGIVGERIIVPRPRKAERGIWKYRALVRPSVRDML
jgi:hypothetical protein